MDYNDVNRLLEKIISKINDGMSSFGELQYVSVNSN